MKFLKYLQHRNVKYRAIDFTALIWLNLSEFKSNPGMLLVLDVGVELFCVHAYSDANEFPLYQLIIREKVTRHWKKTQPIVG